MERFKHKVKSLKSQFSQHSMERLTTMNDVRGAILRLFTATGLAKVSFDSVGWCYHIAEYVLVHNTLFPIHNK